MRKGQKCSKEARLNMSIAHIGNKHSAETIKKLKLSQPKGKYHYKWKGDNAGYRALHYWVEKLLGKPRFCEFCGDRSLKHRQYHWANKSRAYKRILKDWIRLCAKCHKKYDKKIL